MGAESVWCRCRGDGEQAVLSAAVNGSVAFTVNPPVSFSAKPVRPSADHLFASS